MKVLCCVILSSMGWHLSNKLGWTKLENQFKKQVSTIFYEINQKVVWYGLLTKKIMTSILFSFFYIIRKTR
jgi:hypothetical protein